MCLRTIFSVSKQEKYPFNYVPLVMGRPLGTGFPSRLHMHEFQVGSQNEVLGVVMVFETCMELINIYGVKSRKSKMV